MDTVLDDNVGKQLMDKIEKIFKELTSRTMLSQGEVIDILFSLHSDAEKIRRVITEYHRAEQG